MHKGACRSLCFLPPTGGTQSGSSGSDAGGRSLRGGGAHSPDPPGSAQARHSRCTLALSVALWHCLCSVHKGNPKPSFPYSALQATYSSWVPVPPPRCSPQHCSALPALGVCWLVPECRCLLYPLQFWDVVFAVVVGDSLLRYLAVLAKVRLNRAHHLDLRRRSRAPSIKLAADV